MVEKKNGLVILDRDGTLIKHVPYLVEESLVELIPKVGPSLRKLSELGFELAIASNQSVIGLNLASESAVEKINNKVSKLLETFGVFISYICICPHIASDNCNCRKPSPGMGLEIFEALGYGPQNSIMVGDNVTDLEFARNLGIPSIQFNENGQYSLMATRICSNWDEVLASVIELLPQSE